MEDWNSHPRYCLLWYSQPCFYKWIIASVSLRQRSRPRADSVSCFILASSNAQYWHRAESIKIRIGKHLNFMTNIEPLCSKTTPSSEQQKRSQSCPPVADLRQAKTKMRKWFDCLVVKSEIPNIFNLRVEYIRPTAVTRFTCCHLLPVGGKIWGSEADRGKAHTRAEQTRDRCPEKYWGIPNSHLCSVVHFIMAACASDDCPKTKTVNCLQVG